MSAGPHVFGGNRRGLWIAYNESLTDKLKHYLPRLRNAIPNLTDLFLPPQAGPSHKDQCRQADFFVHTYDVAHGRDPVAFAKEALSRRQAQGTGALELNFEGSAISDSGMADYITKTIAQVRKTNPNLPVRINVVPFKGEFLPVDLINNDRNLFVCVQGYGGNMDLLYAADEVKRNLADWGILEAKANVMHAIMCSRGSGPRHLTLPTVRDKGAFYIDDLLLDAGLL